MEYVSDKNKIPVTPHFAALVFSSVYIPGDERIRSSPAHTESVVKYITFQDRNEMEKWVNDTEKQQFGKTEYKIIEAHPRNITTKIIVD